MAQQIQNPKSKTQNWSDLSLIIILTLLPCLFFWRLLTPNPADHMVIAAGDFTEQYFPLRAFVAQQWVRGQIPLWNPYLFGGQPALADIQSGALYPPHVLQSLFLGWRGIGFPVWALEWQVIAHFSLAAVGTYLFIRHLGRQNGISLRRARFGGVMASLAFTYGGYLTGFPVQQITILEASAWLPWVMWAVSVVGQQINEAAHQATVGQPRLTLHTLRSLAFLLPRSPALFWGALAFALAILAGHPQTVLYIFYLSLVYTLFRAFNELTSLRPTQPKSTFILQLSAFILMLALGICLAAAQLLPTREFIAHSLRADLSYQAVSAGLPLNEFISILYPGFFGGSPQYVGIVSLILIALALLISLNPKSKIPKGHFVQNPKSRNVFFWAGAGLVSLLLAFGGNTFLYPLFYLFAPGFEAVRQQERAFMIYSFSAAILTGYGAMVLAGPLTTLTRSTYARFESRLSWITGAALALTAFFIYGSAVSTARGDEVNLFYGVLWHHIFGLVILGGMLILLRFRARRWLRRPWGMALLALWLAFNLFTVNWRFNLEKPADPPPFIPTGLVQFLQTNLPPLDSKAPRQGRAEHGQPSNLPTRIVSSGLLPGGNSAASVYNLQDLTGNTPLQLAAVENFTRQMPSWRLWQLLNVRYVLNTRDIADAGLKPVFAEGELKVFELGDPFPRAWFVEGAEVITNDNEAIARLASDTFDLRQRAIVPASLDLPATDLAVSTVAIIALDPTYLKAEVNAAGQQLLVFSQIYYPGWQATIDGQATELLQVNVVQQGVVVPPGPHAVELTYRPWSFWVGGIVSGAALLICLLGLLWPRR